MWQQVGEGEGEDRQASGVPPGVATGRGGGGGEQAGKHLGFLQAWQQVGRGRGRTGKHLGFLQVWQQVTMTHTIVNSDSPGTRQSESLWNLC